MWIEQEWEAKCNGKNGRLMFESIKDLRAWKIELNLGVLETARATEL